MLLNTSKNITTNKKYKIAANQNEPTQTKISDITDNKFFLLRFLEVMPASLL
ncbi:MAG: hypothetical protein NTU73_09385 [Ignavibacteriae bacterium]|nr:hypothetical protein [Ignavibacteriota bacterium]